MSKHSPLSKSELTKALTRLELTWLLTPKGTQIHRTFTFRDFLAAFLFVARVTVRAEVAAHHPELELAYGRVKVRLSSRDVKGVTTRDLELARTIDQLYERVGGGDK